MLLECFFATKTLMREKITAPEGARFPVGRLVGPPRTLARRRNPACARECSPGPPLIIRTVDHKTGQEERNILDDSRPLSPLFVRGRRHFSVFRRRLLASWFCFPASLASLAAFLAGCCDVLCRRTTDVSVLDRSLRHALSFFVLPRFVVALSRDHGRSRAHHCASDPSSLAPTAHPRMSALES